ncbi:Hcp family type VI secretion system effector [Sphingomonas sp. Leaf343]|uniref:Hcp family type VI secretion system effector n=1 Tax=Sphingomonas sp. Leaf343 TaxID=1736345 RepID=UPI0006F4A12D|nr:type VI secretion system tube protein Hcp [Sphingomonas sp. Leaf343]KQR84070.1 hypothetical protein ASG07_05570 [Sphingomonas sp. Leaf343]
MPIYLELDGIKGSTTNGKYKDIIEVASFQWGAGLGVGSARGGDRSTSTASVSEITISKTLDKSSELLFKALLKGDVIAKGKFSFVATSKGETTSYLDIAMEKIIISGFSVSSGGDWPSESLSLNIAKFDQAFSGRDTEHTLTPTHLIYDLATEEVNA